MNTIKTIIATAILASLTGSVLAASDGSLGATSTGTSDISLTISDRVQISSVADISLGAYGGSGNLTGSSAFCVYRNGGDDYTLTLTADTGAFAIESATTGDSIAFSARVDDDTDASDGAAIAYNTASGNLVGSASTTCGGADNAALHVSFTEANLQAVSSANDYQATVTILVTPI